MADSRFEGQVYYFGTLREKSKNRRKAENLGKQILSRSGARVGDYIEVEKWLGKSENGENLGNTLLQGILQAHPHPHIIFLIDKDGNEISIQFRRISGVSIIMIREDIEVLLDKK